MLNFFKKWSWEFFLLTLTIIHLIPLWSNNYFPSQDGPSHIYNAHLFLQLLNSDNWQVQQVYSLNIGWIPNSIAHIFFVGGLALNIPPLIIEKIFVSMAIGLLPFSISYVAASFDKKAKLVSLIGFVLAFHNLLHMGFYSFSISVPIVLFTYGMWVRWHKDLTIRHITIFLFMGMLSFLAHFSSFAVLMVMLSCSLLFNAIEELIVAFKDKTKKLSSLPPILKKLVFKSIILCTLFAPGLVYQLMSKTIHQGHYKGFSWLWEKLFDDALFITYTEDHRLIAHWFWYLFSICLILHIVFRIVKRKAFERRDIMLVSLIFLTYIYFDLPIQSNGGGWVNHRLLIFVLIFIWLCLDRFPLIIQSAIACFILFISFQQLILFERDYRLLQHDLNEFSDISKQIEPHSIIRVDRNHGNSKIGIPHHTRYVSPLLHAPCYAGLAKDAAYSANYEADHKYFWVNWKNKPNTNSADYIVQWNGVDVGSKNSISYEEIMRSKHMKLLKLKHVMQKSISDPIKAGHTIKLRFNENNLNENIFNVNTKWQPGKAGWVNASYLHNSSGTVSSEFNQTLRVELPSGKYLIKFLLKSKQQAYAINAKVDEELLLDKHRVPAGSFHEQPCREIEIKHNRLNLVLSSAWKKGNSHNQLGSWSLQGIDIIPMEKTDSTQNGLELKTSGWVSKGFFADTIKIDFPNSNKKNSIYWSTNGGIAGNTHHLWNREPIDITKSCEFSASLWFEGNAIATAGYELKKVEKRSALFFPPINVTPPKALMRLDIKNSGKTIDGWLKISREGVYEFEINDLNGHILTLNDQSIFKEKQRIELWLKRGFYKLYFKSTYDDKLPELYYSSQYLRRTLVTQAYLWVKQD